MLCDGNDCLRMNNFHRVADFLNAIGLETNLSVGVKGTFLPGVQIVEGRIRFCSEQALPSDLLHEAGHLAVVPAQFRALMSGDLFAATELMFDQCKNLDSDDLLAVHAMQAGECEATAWSWAAGLHLGLTPDVIIPNESFEGDGEGVRLYLKTRQFFGIHGLARGLL